MINGLFLSDYTNSELPIHYQSANIDQSLYERIKVLQKQYKAEQHPKKILSDSGINQYNISFSTVSDYEKPQRRITFDDLIIVIEVLVFISIMSIIINLLWRFKLKIPAYFFLLTTALISCAVLLLLIFD
ncbi:hypothetical protein [Bartonella henselae]|uniref:Hypothetical genomic island protein n=1 Tax=Bartonella henselae (strain ATCC 49882 / DSM 28221 / CCUG 30454 / Houston 1) TaxID=283166 RepID=A0A0G2Q8L6_BARHE|nr:hypothetical protein [Bartonella henselae]PNM38584.1 hypothetical protein AL470_004070 [Bartonella henselae str. Houston-1]ATP12466.1 hypothetical protein BhenCHDE101_04810 [Bartonella henselae]OLL54707.1 hypothetical protein AT239_07080 [Bartonella henselae]OLL55446.1 hypothetical protein AT240_07130 [Bartonella henselae]UJM36070.1 hypothetical protein KAE77_01650 [Bartonella henselae]